MAANAPGLPPGALQFLAAQEAQRPALDRLADRCRARHDRYARAMDCTGLEPAKAHHGDRELVHCRGCGLVLYRGATP